jgi:hypothetical protein
MEAVRGPGQISAAEYEDRHNGGHAIRQRLPEAAFPAQSRNQAVDEIPHKKYFLHMLGGTFSQVRAHVNDKVFLFPQLSQQAVHKLCQLLHRLSTPLPACWL